jgi:two-component system nitrate/nitrite response regulator NarL
MNNGTLTRPANDSSLPSTSDVSKQLPRPVGVIAEIKQIGASVPLGMIEHEANHVEVPRIDRLIRKGINRRANGAAGPGK